ncbi:MAG: 50S ribosomal protein L11 [Mycoplasmataceae bacterium]|nr:50S ribosomal protein L11 [Mycoplasmataceae bacterium]
MLVAAKKEITRIAKIQLIGGQAKPGPALASIGINMAEFTKQFNDKTKTRNGEVVPCVITAFSDKSFTFIIKTSPSSVMLKKAAKVEIAGKNQLTDNVATISREDALAIAKYKMPDLNAYDEEAALRMIAGTAKQMGIKIEGVDLTPRKTAKAGK